jgi:FAD/FMN-containing dehydrogenase
VVAAAIGNEPVVERHARDLAQLAQQTGASHFAALEDADQQQLLDRVREFLRIVSEQHPGAAVLRAAVLPGNAVRCCESIAAVARENSLQSATLLRAGNTAYAVLHGAGAKGNAAVLTALRRLMRTGSGVERMTIEHLPTEWKSEVQVWAAVREDFALMQRLKQAFDPHGILSPGRYFGGL